MQPFANSDYLGTRSFDEPKYQFGGYIPEQAGKTRGALFDEAVVAMYDLPFELTSTGGRNSLHGAEAVREVSANQIERYVEGRNVFAEKPWFDLGTYKVRIPREDLVAVEMEISRPGVEKYGLNKRTLYMIRKYLNAIAGVAEVNAALYSAGKVPFAFIAEHYPTVHLIGGIQRARKDGLKVVHFDAHRDAKASYMGMKFCHTTPIFHFLSGWYKPDGSSR